ncbi:MAG: hypothetical protein M3154_10930, partial [Candidatus Eremiobacteraeota bacterium]|nr:hypothetical protein [Candidatus Eremiobacteraeota bacterium]
MASPDQPPRRHDPAVRVDRRPTRTLDLAHARPTTATAPTGGTTTGGTTGLPRVVRTPHGAEALFRDGRRARHILG